MLLLCTSTFLFTHTLIRSLLTTLDSHVQILNTFLYCSDFCVINASRGAGVSLFLILVFLSFLIPAIIFFDSCISPLPSIPFLISSKIKRSHCMYYCSARWLLWFRFIACSGYFRLSAYTWGIFLAYMSRRLSLRLRFHVFWEAGLNRVFLVSELGSIENGLDSYR